MCRLKDFKAAEHKIKSLQISFEDHSNGQFAGKMSWMAAAVSKKEFRGLDTALVQMNPSDLPNKPLLLLDQVENTVTINVSDNAIIVKGSLFEAFELFVKSYIFFDLKLKSRSMTALIQLVLLVVGEVYNIPQSVVDFYSDVMRLTE